VVAVVATVAAAAATIVDAAASGKLSNRCVLFSSPLFLCSLDSNDCECQRSIYDCKIICSR